MEFEDIRKKVFKVYEKFSLPHTEVSRYSGRVEKVYSLGFDDLLEEGQRWMRHSIIIEEKLMSLKEVDEPRGLSEWYWNYVVELYNANNGDISGFKGLLKDRIEEINKYYYLETKSIIKFFLDDLTGREMYNQYPKAYITLVSDLCYKNIFLLESEIKNHPEIYSQFKNNFLVDESKRDNVSIHNILKSVEDFDSALERLKEIVIELNDLAYKRFNVNEVLDRSLFSSSNFYPSTLKKWDELNSDEQQKIVSNLNEPVTREERINHIIESISSSTSNKGSANYSADTRRAYFKTFIKNPSLSRTELIDLITDTHTLNEEDEDKLLDDNPSILYSWEKNLRERIKKAGFRDLAQRLKR